MYIYKKLLFMGVRIWFGFSNTTLNVWRSGYRSTFSWSWNRGVRNRAWTGSQHPWLEPWLHSRDTNQGLVVFRVPSLPLRKRTRTTFFSCNSNNNYKQSLLVEQLKKGERPNLEFVKVKGEVVVQLARSVLFIDKRLRLFCCGHWC